MTGIGRVMAGQQYVLTVDMGSSGMRALFVNSHSPWIASIGAERKYRTYRPRNPNSISCRFQPQELLNRALSMIQEALARTDIKSDEVIALTITAQRGGSSFISSQGSTIYVGPNTDLRAIFQGAKIDQALGSEIYAQTGHLPSFLAIPSKLQWWRDHHPRVSRRIGSICTLGSWMAYQLTGSLAEVPTTLAEVGLIDIHSRSVAHSLLREMDIDASLIPDIIAEGTPTGTLSREIADLAGLKQNTPVYLVGPDSQVALMGMGVIDDFDIGIPAGWSAPVQMVTTSPRLDESEQSTWAGLHPMKNKWVAEGSTGDTGGTMDMIRKLTSPALTWDRINALIAESREGANFVTTFWGPHALNLANPGVTMGGLLAPIPISHNPIGSSQVIRATIENIVYAIREAVELVDRVAGSSSDRKISVTGRMGSSLFFSQILANVLNKNVINCGPFATASGAALIAIYEEHEWEPMARDLAANGVNIEPDVRGVMEYSDLFPRWRRLRERLDTFFDEL